jgi:hypothetical protein
MTWEHFKQGSLLLMAFVSIWAAVEVVPVAFGCVK